MSYQVLARKWRPGNFGQLVGQEHVVAAISNALDTDRLHHAYLFTGTRGVGKTTIARIFSKSLNCEQGTSSVPCGICATCKEIEQGNFVDLLEIDAASRTKVEDTRELLDNVQYKPTRGRFKVYLIDEVHMLSKHSFNALLKTLEEPPPHVKFLLATTDPQKLPVTILSRCLQFNLKALSREQISNQLQHILQQEQLEYELPALSELARAAQGSMRDALSLTDQAIAQGNGVVSSQIVTDMLGLMDKNQVLKLLNFILAGNGREALAQLEVMSQQAPDYSRLLSEMLSLLHQVALTQYVPAACKLETSSARAIYQLAKTLPPEQIQLQYQILIQGKKDLAFAADGRSGTEMIVLRMLSFNPQREMASVTDLQTQSLEQPVSIAGLENEGAVSQQSSHSQFGLSDLEQQQEEILRQAEQSPVVESTQPIAAIEETNPTAPQPGSFSSESVASAVFEKSSEAPEIDPGVQETIRESGGDVSTFVDIPPSVMPSQVSFDTPEQGGEQLTESPVKPDTSPQPVNEPQQNDNLSQLERTQQLLAMSRSGHFNSTEQEDTPPVKKSEDTQVEVNITSTKEVPVTRENIGDATPPWLQNTFQPLPSELDIVSAKKEPAENTPESASTPVGDDPGFSRESISADVPPWLQDMSDPAPLPFEANQSRSESSEPEPSGNEFSVGGETLSRGNIGQEVPPWLSEQAEAAPMPFDVNDRPDFSDTEQNSAEVDFDASEDNLDATLTLEVPVFINEREKVLHCSQLDSWSQMIQQMQISALTKQLALHSAYQINNHRVTLTLLESKQHLNSPSAHAQLQHQLSAMLEREIELEIHLGEPIDVPAVIQQGIRHARHAHAIDVIHNSDVIKHFQGEFGANVVEDSIKAR